MSTETLLLLVLIIVVIGALPTWPYSKPWGYAPTGILTLLLLIFIVWAVAGGRPLFRSSMDDAGHDLKAAGRDVADSIRHAVQ